MAKGKKKTAFGKGARGGKAERERRANRRGKNLSNSSKIAKRPSTAKPVTPLPREAVRQEIEALLEQNSKGILTPARIGPIPPVDEQIDPELNVYVYGSDAASARAFEENEVLVVDSSDGRAADATDLQADAMDGQAVNSTDAPTADVNEEQASGAASGPAVAATDNNSSEEGEISGSDATNGPTKSAGQSAVELGIKSIDDAPRMATVREAAHGAEGIPFIPRLPSVFEASMGASAPAFISTLPGMYADDYSPIPFRVNYRKLFEPAPPPIKVIPSVHAAQSGAEQAASESTDADEGASSAPQDIVEQTFVVDCSKRFEPSPSPLLVLDESKGEQTTLTDAMHAQASLENTSSREREEGNDYAAPAPDTSQSTAVPSDSMHHSWVLAGILLGLLVVMMWFGSHSTSPSSLVAEGSGLPLFTSALVNISAFNNSTHLPSAALSQTETIPEAVYLRIGDQARMPDGSVLKLEAISSTPTGLSARLGRTDADGAAAVFELLDGQRAQWMDKDGSVCAVLARKDEDGQSIQGLSLQVLGALEISRPNQIHFSTPTHAYLLNGQYPAPLLLDNKTLQVGQSLQGGSMRVQLAGIESNSDGRHSSIFRMFDGNGSEIGSTVLGGGQMVEMRTLQGERYTLLLLSNGNGAVSNAQLYLNQAFDR